MGNPGKASHQAAVEMAEKALLARGRVIRPKESLPHVLAVKNGAVWAYAPQHYQPETRPGLGRWHASKSKASVRRQWPHLDGVHIYAVKGEETQDDFTRARLLSEGWRFIEMAGKCPDLLLVEGGQVIAIEVLRRIGGSQGAHAASAKRVAYSMFDAVEVHFFAG